MNRKIFKELPFEIHELETSPYEEFLGIHDVKVKTLNYVQIGPKKYLHTGSFKKHMIDLYNFEARSDDVWLFGFPRTGTTMTQEMLWLMGNNLDFETASKTVLNHRFPTLENCIKLDVNHLKKLVDSKPVADDTKEIVEGYSNYTLDGLNNMKGRRFIKTHIPISLAPPHVFQVGCKIIYCARHPKDTIVSSYHMRNLFVPNVQLSFTDYYNIFTNNLVSYTPYLEHLKEGWNMRNNPNFLFLFYEDTVKDLETVLKKVAKFMDRNLSDNDLAKLKEHFKIDNFKKNKSVNNDHFVELGFASNSEEDRFIRRGKIGGWKEYFTPELEKDVDKWMEDNLKDTDIKFP